MGNYPHDGAGWKGEAETGREAAFGMAHKLGRLQKLVRDTLATHGAGGLTPEEAAAALGLDRVSVQPRFAELTAKGVAADSGARRKNPSSGKRAVVWVLSEFATKREPTDE